jgi:hypothetical protein
VSGRIGSIYRGLPAVSGPLDRPIRNAQMLAEGRPDLIVAFAGAGRLAWCVWRGMRVSR